MSLPRRVHARIEGRVQGVFYRQSTADAAKALGLEGWVRNLPDGSVELEAQGPADEVQALLDWCRRGPPQAEVTAVIVRDATPEGGGGTFEVRR